MKKYLSVKWVVVVLFSVIGAVIGYYAGHQADIIGWKMFWQILAGVVLGFCLALSIYEKRIFAWVGLAAGILLSTLVNVGLKARIGIQDVLFILWITTYVGYCLHQKTRPIYIGGGIGGILGFIFGFFASFSIGEISYPRDFIAAICIAISGILLGMFFGTGFSYSSDNKE